MNNCEHCQWWGRSDRLHETFRYLTEEWDIDRGYALVKKIGHPILSVKTWRVAESVDYPKNPDGMAVFKVQVDEDHLNHVDMEKPILIGTTKKDRIVVLDGHHRIARAIRDKIETLPCYLLDEKQTRKIRLRGVL